jgi:hypothetical protein
MPPLDEESEGAEESEIVGAEVVFEGEVVEAPRGVEQSRPRLVVVSGGDPPRPMRVPKIRPGKKLPRSLTLIAHLEGPYDYVVQDGAWMIVWTLERNVLRGSYEHEREAFEAAEKLNESYWLSKGRHGYRAKKWSQRKSAAGGETR